MLAVVRRLRAPDGCPWDRKQTHESLRPYLLEEAAEAADALVGTDPEHAAEELGDVLLQIALHAVIGEEEDAYDYQDIERAIVDKLIRRHPHVFGDVVADTSEQVERNWKAIKEAEGGRPRGPAERVPHGLPALMRAARMGKELDWTVTPEQRAITLSAAAQSPAGIADALLALAQLAREAGVEPEIALRDAIEARAADVQTGQAS